MDTAKRVSSGTIYLLRNGKNTVHMSPIELKECKYISYSVYMCFKCSGCVYIQLGHFLLSSKFCKIAVMVQRSGETLSLLYSYRSKLHPTPEVHYAVPLSSAPHEIELLR